MGQVGRSQKIICRDSIPADDRMNLGPCAIALPRICVARRVEVLRWGRWVKG
jgi:hypothetical protein